MRMETPLLSGTERRCSSSDRVSPDARRRRVITCSACRMTRDTPSISSPICGNGELMGDVTHMVIQGLALMSLDGGAFLQRLWGMKSSSATCVVGDSADHQSPSLRFLSVATGGTAVVAILDAGAIRAAWLARVQAPRQDRQARSSYGRASHARCHRHGARAQVPPAQVT